ncbi:hypothetical protein E5288_WYG016655 [Bos mutus]|uniref:Uncharacterized protein n=1 Tax=Bos mutus TaxID=72004 RepID=A0A6B0R6Z0_9CETA|nr:hypothetical protein [Bos mutus]
MPSGMRHYPDYEDMSQVPGPQVTTNTESTASQPRGFFPYHSLASFYWDKIRCYKGKEGVTEPYNWGMIFRSDLTWVTKVRCPRKDKEHILEGRALPSMKKGFLSSWNQKMTTININKREDSQNHT